MRNDTQPPSYNSWAQGVREVPDMLIAAQLSLGPLAKGEAIPTNDEARRIVGDACALLRVALTNLVEGTRNLRDFPLEPARAEGVDTRRDPRMSPRPDAQTSGMERLAEQCALTRRLESSFGSFPQSSVRLTDEQLDRLRRCANGNTLRFESSDIVAALVAAGYATEGVGCIVTVTPKGHRYLEAHPA